MKLKFKVWKVKKVKIQQDSKASTRCKVSIAGNKQDQVPNLVGKYHSKLSDKTATKVLLCVLNFSQTQVRILQTTNRAVTSFLLSLTLHL